MDSFVPVQPDPDELIVKVCASVETKTVQPPQYSLIVTNPTDSD
jgi:hypothetical protein